MDSVGVGGTGVAASEGIVGGVRGETGVSTRERQE